MKTEYYRDVVCPFYIPTYTTTKKDAAKAKRSICCEGICDGGRMITMFPRADKKETHYVCFCCSFKYVDCPIAKMIQEAKYGENN